MTNEYKGRGVANTPYAIYLKVPPILRITQNLPSTKTVIQNKVGKLSLTILYESNFTIKWYREGSEISSKPVMYSGSGPKTITEEMMLPSGQLGNTQWWAKVFNEFGEEITSSTCQVTVKLSPPNITTLTPAPSTITPEETTTMTYMVKSEDPYELNVYMQVDGGSKLQVKSINKPAVGDTYTPATFTLSGAELDAVRPDGSQQLNRYTISVEAINDSGSDWSETTTLFVGKDIPSIASITWLRNEEVTDVIAKAIFRVETTDTFYANVSASGGSSLPSIDGTQVTMEEVYHFSRVGDYSFAVNFPRDSQTHNLTAEIIGTLDNSINGKVSHRGRITANKSVAMAPKPPEPLPEFTYTMTEEADENGYVYVFKATAANTGYFTVDYHWTKDGSSPGWTNETGSRWVAGEVRTIARLKSPGGIDNLVKFKATNLDGISKQSQNFTFSYPPIPPISLTGSCRRVTIKWYDSDGGVITSYSYSSSARATLMEDLPAGYRVEVGSDLGSETWYGPQAKGKRYSRSQSPYHGAPSVSSVSYTIYDSEDRIVARDRYKVSTTSSGDVVWV